ncbi:MAG: carbohydrate kinase [Cellulomonadaceae bacterium]|jgi:fructokinase|nr:carbohydrate kinase [Cellulomonadaceae bacterium]
MNLVVMGEALVDVVTGTSGKTQDLPGGSPANVAVGLARLGRKPHLITSLGTDARGRSVTSWLEGAGVVPHVSAPPSGRTSTATVTLDKNGRASYEFNLGWDLDPVHAIEGAWAADVLHVGSIATVLEPGANVIEQAVRSAHGRTLLTFDPNARPTITPDVDAARTRVERLVRLCSVVKVSDEDLQWYYPGETPEVSARRWVEMGAPLVVVTLGSRGAIAVHRIVVDDVKKLSTVKVAGRKVSLVDTIGAGDTFMAGLIDALVTLLFDESPRIGPRIIEDLTTADITRALTWANVAAAANCESVGATPPTCEQVTAMVNAS